MPNNSKRTLSQFFRQDLAIFVVVTMTVENRQAKPILAHAHSVYVSKTQRACSWDGS